MSMQDEPKKYLWLFERLIQAIFCSLLAILIGMAVDVAAPVLMLPYVFFTVVIALLLIGLSVWAWSERRIALMQITAVESSEPVEKKHKHNLLLELCVLTIAWFEGFLLRAQKLNLNILSTYWQWSMVFALGILFFYTISLVLLRVFSRSHDSERVRKTEREIQHALVGILEHVPVIAVGVFFYNTIAPVVLGHYWAVSIIVATAAVAAVGYIQNSKEVQVPEGSLLGRVHEQSRRFVSRVALGVATSLTAGILLMNAAVLASHPAVVLLFFAAMLFGAQMYVLFLKFSEVLKDSEAPKLGLDQSIVSLVPTAASLVQGPQVMDKNSPDSPESAVTEARNETNVPNEQDHDSLSLRPSP